MKVLLSIKPKYADKIFSGEKKFEYRRTIWKHDVDIVVVYASAPISKIIGEFTVGRIPCGNPAFLWLKTGHKSGINYYDEFLPYFHDKAYGYAIEVANYTLYVDPKPLSDYGITRPPQNFMYLRDDAYNATTLPAGE